LDKQRIELLKNLYKKKPSLFSDVRKAEGALKDIFPDDFKMANTLMAALKIGILNELTVSGSTLPVEVIIPKAAKMLEDQFSIKKEDAVHAIGVWAIVFGRATEDQVKTVSHRFISNESVSRTGSSGARSSLMSYSTDDTRECPFCAEPIKKKAKICKHCKNNIEMIECPFCAEEIIKTSTLCEHCRMTLEATEGVEKIDALLLEVGEISENNIEELDSFLRKNDRFETIKKSADNGHTNAQYVLGHFYLSGYGVSQNHTEAAKWFRLSANQGNVDAQSWLGACYLDGCGVSENDKEAVKWFKLAAEKGNILACDRLALCYLEGLGVSQNYKESRKWATPAAEAGMQDSQCILGICYHYGNGVVRNYYEAARWYQLSAEQGNSIAINNLGTLYEEGSGVIKDKERALELYKIAADQGLDVAIDNYNRLKDSCFITTAVCKHYNRSDNCYELNLLRWYRDNWLVNNDDGQSLISEYYRIAPEMVGKINSSKDKDSIYDHLEERYIKRCLSLIESKEYDSAKELYIEMMDYLRGLFP
jgi:TPR repeat protein